MPNTFDGALGGLVSATATSVNGGRPQEWVARIARAFGGAIGAVLIGTILVSYSSGNPISPTAIPDASTTSSGTTALALALGLAAAFGLVLALGWRENRPGWPAAGFILGCLLLSGVFISTRFSTDAGVAVAYFPARTWWACILMPALGGLAAYAVLLRRTGR